MGSGSTTPPGGTGLGAAGGRFTSVLTVAPVGASDDNTAVGLLELALGFKLSVDVGGVED